MAKRKPAELKVVVRHLPPALPEHVLRKLLEPYMDQVNLFYYAKGDPGMEKFWYARCYLSFQSSESMVKFARDFDGHRFRNAQGMYMYVCVCK